MQEQKNKILGFPLSYAQKRIWFLHKFEANQEINNVGAVTTMKINLKHDLVIQALQASIDRHEAFRTNFIETANGEPIQIVRDFRQAKIIFFDLSLFDPPSREKKQANIVSEQKKQSFDLEKDQLVRIVLIKKGEGDYVFITTIHSLISDIWSLGILINELYYVCQALFYKQPFKLLPLPLQYKDYASWEQSMEGEKIIAMSEKYWLKKFSGELPVLDLPFDFPRPKNQVYKYQAETLILSEEILDKISTLCQGENTTQFIFFLAVYFLMLFRLSGQDDVIIGTFAANRDSAELENVVGPFLNNLPLRVKINPEENFLEFLRQVKKTVLESMENKKYPFEKLIENLNLPKDAARFPIFSATFQIFDFQEKENITQNLFHNFLEKNDFFDNSLGQFDLVGQIFKTNDKTCLSLNYNVSLFKPETIRRFLDNYEALLKNVLAFPDEASKKKERVSLQEKKYLLEEFNDTVASYPKEKSLYAIFKKQVLRNGDRVAIQSGSKHLTYRELGVEVDKLFKYFSAKGVKRGDIVAVVANNSPEAIAAIIAILKIKAVFLPIDMDTPPERVQYMIKNSGAKSVLTFIKSKGEFISPKLSQVDNTCVAGVGMLTFPQNELDFPVAIFYTSGSTGRPKGVVLIQRGIINHALTKIEITKMENGDSVAQNMSLSFIASLWQFFCPLFVGAKIVVYPKKINQDPPTLFARVAQDGVNILEIVPSVLQCFLQSGVDNEKINQIKCVILTGEAVSHRLVKEFYDKYSVKLINAYGQTECSDDTLHYAYPENFEKKSILGTPSRNTQIYVLDSDLRLKPIGVSGEIYISGDGLAAGYLGDKKATKSSFLPHPFFSGKKIYKTGDWGRILSSGQVEFLGRRDEQIKIRGIRLEIKEIENCLIENREINNCFLAVNSQKELVAYYSANRKITPDFLRDFLESRLPEYMLPVFYVQVEEWPRTINGKIDRLSLPRPRALHRVRAGFIESKSKSEKDVVTVWREVLGIKKIGANDDFFKLGGHSLLCVSVLMKLRAHGYQVSLPQLFRFPKAHLLAAALEKENAKKAIAVKSGGAPFTVIGDFFVSEGIEKTIHQDKLEFFLINCEQKIFTETLKTLEKNYYHLYSGTKISWAENKIFFIRQKEKISSEVFTEALLKFQEIYNQILVNDSRGVFSPFCSYPEHYHCLHAAGLEFLRAVEKKFFYKSLPPALDLFCLPNYWVMENGLRRDSDFNGFFLCKQNRLNSQSFLNIDYKVLAFPNSEMALDYYEKERVAGRPILAAGNNYYLPSSLYYRSKDFIKAIQENRNLFPINLSIFYGQLDNLTVYSPNLNYLGKISQKDFVSYWRNLAGFKNVEAAKFKQFGKPYQVLQIMSGDSRQKHTLDSLYQALGLNVSSYFQGKILKKKFGAQAAYFGKEAMAAFSADIKKNIDYNKIAISDIFIIDFLKRSQKPWLFLLDLLRDIRNLNEDFSNDLGKVGDIILDLEKSFELLYNEIRRKNIAYEPVLSFFPSLELNGKIIFSQDIKKNILSSLEKIEKKQSEVYASLREKLKDLDFEIINFKI